jgi:hypothetical protein
MLRSSVLSFVSLSVGAEVEDEDEIFSQKAVRNYSAFSFINYVPKNNFIELGGSVEEPMNVVPLGLGGEGLTVTLSSGSFGRNILSLPSLTPSQLILNNDLMVCICVCSVFIIFTNKQNYYFIYLFIFVIAVVCPLFFFYFSFTNYFCTSSTGKTTSIFTIYYTC